MGRVFLFSGPAGSGKDTSCNIFKKLLTKYNVATFAFGDSLKLIVQDVSKLYLGVDFPVSDMAELEYKERERPEYNMFMDNKKYPLKIRTLLQQIGTNILRKHLDEDIFVDSVLRKMDKFFKGSGEKIVIITDLRFENEYEGVRRYCERNGHKMETIYINRKRILDSHGHISEGNYCFIKKDHVIDNNGTMEELEDKMKSIIEKFA